MTGEPQPRGADAELAAALDALIPGGNGWLRASDCVSPTVVLARLSASDRAWVLARIEDARGDWHDAWSRAEALDPECFQRHLAALYDAYYRTEGVARRLRAVAEAGPRDLCQAFEPALLNATPRTESP